MKYDTKLRIARRFPWLPIYNHEDMMWQREHSFSAGQSSGLEIGFKAGCEYLQERQSAEVKDTK